MQPRICYRDAHIIVVDKPPGLTTMRHGYEAAQFGRRARKYLPVTLADIISKQLSSQSRQVHVHAVHRIDKDTSGLVVFALTLAAERDLMRQFREHSVERRYLAIVRGRAETARHESSLINDRGDGRRGSTQVLGDGQRAVTHVAVVERLGDFTLVECRLETGRTHQVRIHLGEAGTPLCGERIYDRPVHGRPFNKDVSGIDRPALHAQSLGLQHPVTGKKMKWSAPMPPDMTKLLARLRRLASDPAQ